MAFLTLMSIYPVLYVWDLFRIPKDQVQGIEKGDSKRTFNTIYFTERRPPGSQQGANTLTHGIPAIPALPTHGSSSRTCRNPNLIIHSPALMGSKARGSEMVQIPTLPLAAVSTPAGALTALRPSSLVIKWCQEMTDLTDLRRGQLR